MSEQLELPLCDREVWRDIAAQPGYQISNLGGTRSLTRVTVHKNGARATYKGRVLKQQWNRKGYRRVSFSGGERKTWSVHRLVLEYFSPFRDVELHCNHIDHNKENNRLDNLEWITNLENNRLSWKNGRTSKKEVNHV